MKNPVIRDIRAREILDSRGHPTIEADVVLDTQVVGRAASPSGASTGTHEAVELRDGNRRFGGKGVQRAIDHVQTEIADLLVGRHVEPLSGLDQAMIALDGQPSLARLGANAVLSVSLAAAVAAAEHYRLPLYRYLGGAFACTMPVPLVNVLNGGAHAANNVDIQEFMIVPHGSGQWAFSDAIQAASEIFHALGKALKQQNLSTATGDEGGYAPNLSGSTQALDLIVSAIEQAGYTAGDDVSLALDVAATELFHEGDYILPGEQLEVDADGMTDYLSRLADNYPIVSIEDGMAEDDAVGWQSLTDALADRIQLVGDDLFVTQRRRLNSLVGLGNAILIKPNQAGTLTETVHTIIRARELGLASIVSHRSGETEDTFIADLVVAFGCGQIKTGSMARSERLAKYNRLLRIEEDLGELARFAGLSLMAPARSDKGND